MKQLLLKSLKLLFACAVLACLCASCTTEITLELKKDGSVDVDFSGTAGNAFTALITSASGMSDTKADSPSVIFDTKQIEYEISSNGFSKVKVASKKGTDLAVS